MNSINFLLLFLLIFALVLSLFKTGKNARIARAFRILITFLGILFFGYWFFQKSLNNFLEKSMSVQVINRLNQPIDFYAIKVINKDKNQFLEDEIKKRTKEVVAIQNVTIFAMASLAETRDNETGKCFRTIKCHGAFQ